MSSNMSSNEEAFAELSQRPGFLLAKQAGTHLAVWLLSFSLFAATDSWSALTGSSLASLLSLLTGILAGFVTVNLVHEWFHYFGARLVSGHYTIAARPGLFVFDWQFDRNSLRSFYVMSIAGSVGGALAVWYLFANITPDNSGRAALLAAAVASFVFAAIVEWPVLWRTRRSRDPLAELSTLTLPVLGMAFAASVTAGVICWLTLT